MLSSSLRDETKNGCEASFQVSDLLVAKTNRGRSVSQVLLQIAKNEFEKRED